jgi:hypothetical protein
VPPDVLQDMLQFAHKHTPWGYIAVFAGVSNDNLLSKPDTPAVLCAQANNISAESYQYKCPFKRISA